MDKYSEENIISFLTDLVGCNKITSTTDIFLSLGVRGDDFHELMETYAIHFSVDMTSYLWYFHADEEGQNSFGGSFFKPPYESVTRIPVTPKMLVAFANKGKWAMEYPAHSLPKRRYDLILNKSLVIGFLIMAATYLIRKFVFQ